MLVVYTDTHAEQRGLATVEKYILMEVFITPEVNDEHHFPLVFKKNCNLIIHNAPEHIRQAIFRAYHNKEKADED